MADKFNPRGAPVPSTGYYDGWELTHRPDVLPFLAEYTNAQGDRSGGMAMPSMVEEPINALSRLLNTPSGTMPDPNDSQNRQDALLGLMSLYGGNALGGMARGAAGRAAGHAFEMEAARPVAYSNAFEGAMSNPNLLRMMDDIDYAGLNRRALDDYGVGYEGLTSSQEAALRGWSDPAMLDLFSDTGKPNPVGAAVAGNVDNIGFDVWHGSPHDFDKFDMSKIGSGEGAQAYGHGLYFADSEGVAKSYREPNTGGWGGETLTFNGIPQDRLPPHLSSAILTLDRMAGDVGLIDDNLIKVAIGDLEKRLEELKKSKDQSVLKYNVPSVENTISGLKEIEGKSGSIGKEGVGYLYQTRINADPNHFLDWDKPLSQQSDNVRNAVEAAAPGLADEYARMRATGHAAFQNPEIPISQYAVQPGMSEKLRDAGIPGIKYLDQGSRGAGEGTSNYVLFNDALANIVHKWRGDQQLYSDTGRPNPLGASLVPGAERQPDHLPGPDPDLWPYIY